MFQIKSFLLLHVSDRLYEIFNLPQNTQKKTEESNIFMQLFKIQ